jgi:hypothetical protein
MPRIKRVSPDEKATGKAKLLLVWLAGVFTIGLAGGQTVVGLANDCWFVLIL